MEELTCEVSMEWLNEHERIIYNQALDDLSSTLLEVISRKYSYPYFDNAIWGIVNDALVDARAELSRE